MKNGTTIWLTSNYHIFRCRFQMVSLLKLANVTEEGVRFLSPHDGTPMYVSALEYASRIEI
jgi:queuine/archaeosine tRNA-ribosyltransferase